MIYFTGIFGVTNRSVAQINLKCHLSKVMSSHRRPVFFFLLANWIALQLMLNSGSSYLVNILLISLLLLGSWLQAVDAIKTKQRNYDRVFSLRKLVAKLLTEREAQAKKITQLWKVESTLQSLGFFSASVLHNISGPLSTLNGIMSEISNQLSNRQRSDIEACLGYVCAVVRHARLHLRQEETPSDEIRLAECFARIHDVTHNIAVYKSIKLQIDCPQNLILQGDFVLLQQILLNLVQNSIEAMSESQNAKIYLHARKDGKKIIIALTDNGSGMSKNHLRRLGQRFFTIKKGHAGLGVSFVQDTLKKYFGGSCRYHSIVGEGTTAYIYLPVQ